MAITFVPRPLARSSFVGLALPMGIGFFRDGDFLYAVMQRSHFKLEVFNRTSKSKTFSETIAELPEAFRVAVNGNYFHLDATQYYLTAIAGELDLGAIKSDGNVIHNGAILLPDQHRGNRYFFFGRDNGSPPKYIVGGPGNPSTGDIFEGMGGLGPMIMRNPTTGAPMPFGTTNIFASDPQRNGDPKTPADFADLVQHYNNTYQNMHNLSVSDRSGLCVLAACDALDLLFAIVKDHKEGGSLDQVRDKLLEVGCEHAVFADGSSSVTLAADRETVIKPRVHKNNTIETGFAFVAQSIPKTLTVSVRGVTFSDDGSVDFSVTGNGTQIVSFSGRSVSAGAKIALTSSRGFAVDPSKNLSITLKATGTDTSGTFDDDLGEVELQLTRENDYQVGRRTHRSSDDEYDLDIEITIA